MMCTGVARSLAACLMATPMTLVVSAPAHARPVGDHQGMDTHITGIWDRGRELGMTNRIEGVPA
jgi:hypothetical protein